MFTTAVKEKAIKLRKKGYSQNEIRKLLNISQSTASIWLRDVKLSASARQRIQLLGDKGREKANTTIRRRSLVRSQAIDHSVKEYLARVQFPSNQAKSICAFLYGCEGAKNETRVAFTNSDPELIHFFLLIFRKAFSVDERKFRVAMHLHPYHNEKRQRRFWSRVSGISEAQFSKTYQKKNGEKNIREGYPGCISVRYNNGAIQKELVRLYKEMLKRGDRIFI